MKEIFIILSVLSLFVGCASTPNTSITPKKNTNEIFNGVYDEAMGDIYDDVYWADQDLTATRLRIDDMKIYKLRKPSDAERNFRVQNTFNKLTNSIEITGRDFMKILGCHQFMVEQYKSGAKDPFYTLRDFLNEKNQKSVEYDSFTGKIINNTNETLKLFLSIARTKDDERNIYFEIPPHEEKYFKVQKSIDCFFGIYDIVGRRMRIITWFGKENPDNKYGESASGIEYDLQAEYTKYILNNYSFEMSFDDKTYNQNLNSWVQNYNYWTLVPRYKVKDDASSKVLSRDEVKKQFNVIF